MAGDSGTSAKEQQLGPKADSWGLIPQDDNRLEAKAYIIPASWELRRGANRKARSYCSSSTAFPKVRRSHITRLGKKLLGATVGQGGSASTDLYDSITSSAAKVKEDLMYLAC